MDNKNQENLQSRREFFKNAAKAALPVIGAVVLSSIPLQSRAGVTDCNGNCSIFCEGSCQGGCETTCRGGCDGSCNVTCSGSCSGTCTGGSNRIHKR